MTLDEAQILSNLFNKADSFISRFNSDSFKAEEILKSAPEKLQTVVTEKSDKTTVQSSTSPAIKTKKSIPSEQPVFAHTDNKITIKTINDKIIKCTRCPLARTRTNVVPGQGVENPDVLVIGEGPGYEEDVQGLPFVGKAGILLDKMLAAIGLDRKSNCYIANIVKCRPPQNRDPSFEEQAACISFLEAQIQILKPKMILCMGRISGQKLLNTESTLSQLRGKFYEYNNIPLLVTYHPSALLRNENLKKDAWEDLKLFKKRLNEISGS